MHEELEERGTAAVAQRLRSQTAFLSAQWQVECAGEASLPDPTALLLGLAEAVDGTDQEGDLGPAPSLHALAVSLVEQGPDLDIVVRHLGALREVLHRHVVTALPAETALDAQHELNTVIDALIEMCTSGVTSSLQEAAFVDPLTGLLNRRALERDLRRELALGARHGHSVSLVVGDLDGLKAINDTLGHAAGDAALCALATAVESALRAGDAGYRIGGDEFVILLPMSPAADVARVVERVTSAEAPAFGWGQATFPDDGAEPAELLDIADHRLLDARSAARQPDPMAPAPAPARKAKTKAKPVAMVRRRRRHPLLSTTFLAISLSGGVGLASAANGQLPGPAQEWAHDVLAKVGLTVPAGNPDTVEDDPTMSARPWHIPAEPVPEVHGAAAVVMGEAENPAGLLPGELLTGEEGGLVDPITPRTLARPGSDPKAVAARAVPVLVSEKPTTSPDLESRNGPDWPEGPADVYPAPLPTEPDLVAPDSSPDSVASVPSDGDTATPPELEQQAPDVDRLKPDADDDDDTDIDIDIDDEIDRIDQPGPPRQRFLGRWVRKIVGHLDGH